MSMIAAVVILANLVLCVAQDPVKIVDLDQAPFSVTEKTFKGTTSDIVWSGPDNQNVFLLTTTGELFRSVDHGKSWTNEQPKLSAHLSQNSALPTIAQVISHETDSNRLFFLGDGHASKCFSTADGGVTYTVIAENMILHEVKMHPTDPDLVIASSLSAGCFDEMSQTTCHKTLFVSKDFGVSWTQLETFVVQFDWTANLPFSHTRGIPKQSILYTKQNKPNDGKQMFGVWDKTINLWRSDDLCKTSKMLVEGGNRFLFTSKYLLVAKVHENNEHVRLYISMDGSRSFKEAGLPFEMAEHSYTILDTADDSIFLHVNHWGENARFGNVYVSNSHGLNYTLSLPHNTRDGNGRCDFEKVKGLEGIYIANYQDNVDFDAAYDHSIHNADAPKKALHNKQLTENKSFEKHRTVITFDKGGEWGYIPAPKFDSDGVPVKCVTTNGCSLNLHGISGSSGAIYSLENAIGLLIANGNTGTFLYGIPSKESTFFSRDAGLTWKMVAKGHHIYEFGDHGGLIVMAQNQEATNAVMYSWDEGHTWNRMKFTEKPMIVDNIVIEPSALSQKFMIYGSREDATGQYGVIAFLDFADLHTRACAGVDSPDTTDSDYEVWTVAGSSADKCLMGRQVSYVRRKQFNQCFNGVEMERPIFVKNCECTDRDWECDFTHTRDKDDASGKISECHEVFKINQTKFIEEQCSYGESYYLISGYRKVAGDSCFNGVDHTPKTYPCVHWTNHISHSGWTVVMFFVLMAASLGSITFIASQKKGSRHFSFNAPRSTMEFIYDTYDSVKDTVSDYLPGSWRYGYFTPGDRIPDSALDLDINSSDLEEPTSLSFNGYAKKKKSDDYFSEDFHEINHDASSFNPREV